ncbi:MAG: D-glycero-beta-D-manno-heptose-7-phosphate kinase [Saprospiraceae bacterium]
MVKSADLLKAFTKLNILVVGDVMIDRYLRGQVDRISPEAPVPVVLLKDRDNRLGGAANVALNLAALGVTPYLCSIIGQDENGQLFQNLLPKQGISAKSIITSKTRKTTVKTRVIAQQQHLLRVDTEDTHDISDEERSQLLKKIQDILDNREIHAILFQDYNKGVLSRKSISEIILEAIKRDIPTAVDPKNKNFWAYKHATLFKPNLKEIRAQLPYPINPQLESLQKAAAEITGKLGNQMTLITLSEDGLYVNRNEKGQLLAAVPRNITDVCGAGDSVISVATAALALGLDTISIAALANLAGGQVCEKVGVVPVDAAQLQKEYEQYRSQHHV